MAAKKAPMRKPVAKKPVAKKPVAKKSPTVKGTKKTSGNLNRVTSNIPSVYQPGTSTPMRETGGNSNSRSFPKGARGLRTEPTSIKKDRFGLYNSTTKSGRGGTYNRTKPGKSTGSPYGGSTKTLEQSEYSDNFSKDTQKAGNDARGRASKYGKPVGKTFVGGSRAGKGSQNTWAQTTVRASNGRNEYVVFEDKNQRKFRKDQRRTTRVEPSAAAYLAAAKMNAAYGGKKKKK